MTVFPPSTPLERFLDGRAGSGLRQALGLSSRHLLVLSVGRLAPEKGHDILVRAFGLVVEAVPEARLALAGLGGQEEPLRNLISDLGLDRHVFLLGFRDDIPALYAEADLAALTPVAGESFGIALLEAYASGLACVATDVGGVKDLVLEGQTGFLCPPGDIPRIAAALIACLKDEGLRQRMAQAGKARVLERFTPQRLGDTAERLFRQLQKRGHSTFHIGGTR
jgi:glycosyltransferase involved in cell wall biosynthesis